MIYVYYYSRMLLCLIYLWKDGNVRFLCVFFCFRILSERLDLLFQNSRCLIEFIQCVNNGKQLLVDLNKDFGKFQFTAQFEETTNYRFLAYNKSVF